MFHFPTDRVPQFTSFFRKETGCPADLVSKRFERLVHRGRSWTRSVQNTAVIQPTLDPGAHSHNRIPVSSWKSISMRAENWKAVENSRVKMTSPELRSN